MDTHFRLVDIEEIVQILSESLEDVLESVSTKIMTATATTTLMIS